MRLNWFVPFRKPSPGVAGVVRRLLTRLAPSWLYSPLRRVVQVACLAAFVWLFFLVCLPDTTRQDQLGPRIEEAIQVETFLWMDPLAGISTSLAARAVSTALWVGGAVLAVCLAIPRGFCGYVCPLGTLIDLTDTAVGRWARPLHIRRRGWWVHLKYYVLIAVLLASAFGVLVAPLVSAIPVLTRAMQFGLAPLQQGEIRGWHLVRDLTAAQIASLALFGVILALTFLGPRFWCRFVCPSGAVFSLANLLRLSKRAVTSDCIRCGRCAGACTFDAIQADFSTRGTNCTFCQSCGGACPTRAIQFAPRGVRVDPSAVPAPPAEPAAPADPALPAEREVPLSRRGILGGTIAGLGGVLGLARFYPHRGRVPVRPPGSVPEDAFLALCIRCGQCLKACPSGILQPAGLELGPEALWAPRADADWAGCDPKCNNCGQVCPTGAIRALALEERTAARMGRAVVDRKACLPHAGVAECSMCHDACESAGYEAIEFRLVGLEFDEIGRPVEGSGYTAPKVLAHRCVGCGLCQTRCRQINVESQGLLAESAIQVVAGPGKEDRISQGSYVKRRRARQERYLRENMHVEGEAM